MQNDKTPCQIHGNSLYWSCKEAIPILKHVFLDLDDTILDFSGGEAHALSRTLREVGVEPKPEVLRLYHELNIRCWEALERGELTREQVLVQRYEQLFAELGLSLSGAEVNARYERHLALEHDFLPGAQALLETLYPRYSLYLASNGSLSIQRRRLTDADLWRWFRGVFISEEVGANKPSPLFFERCFAAVPAFQAAEAVMVGDSLTSDIRGGRDAGLRTVWLNRRGGKAPPELRPTAEIQELAQLPALLETF